MSEKELWVWALNTLIGEEEAQVKQQVDDAQKLAAFEAWFRQEILGHKSTYQDVEND